MDIIGIEIELFSIADENKVYVSFAGLGITKDDFIALSITEQSKIISKFVSEMQDQPKWKIDDFCFLAKAPKPAAN